MDEEEEKDEEEDYHNSALSSRHSPLTPLRVVGRWAFFPESEKQRQ